MLLEHFPQRVARQRIYDTHLARALVHRKLLGNKVDKPVRIDIR